MSTRFFIVFSIGIGMLMFARQVSAQVEVSGFTEARVDADIVKPSNGKLSGPGSEQVDVAFSVPVVAFMFDTEVHERLRFKVELAFVTHEDGIEIEFQRALADLELTRYVSLKIGHFYNPLGFWQRRYNNRGFLRPSANDLMGFSDVDQVVPFWTTGLSFYGDLDWGEWTLRYNAALGNGRGDASNLVRAGGDGRDFKSPTLSVELSDGRWILGAGVQFNQIRAKVPELDEIRLNETIGSGYIRYEGSGFVVHAEGAVNRAIRPKRRDTFTTFVGVGQITLRSGIFRNYQPYLYANYYKRLSDAANPYFSYALVDGVPQPRMSRTRLMLGGGVSKSIFSRSRVIVEYKFHPVGHPLQRLTVTYGMAF